MRLQPAIHLTLTGLLAATPPIWAKPGDADATMRRFMGSCERAEKSEAIHECALAKSVQAGDVTAAVVQACRADLGPAPLANPNEQVWLCAKQRQFGPRMDANEWLSVTSNDCHNRSERAGHRYERRRNDCVADAIVEQRRASEADIQRCKATPGIEKNHRLLNCLSQAMQRGGQ